VNEFVRYRHDGYGCRVAIRGHDGWTIRQVVDPNGVSKTMSDSALTDTVPERSTEIDGPLDEFDWYFRAIEAN
jgi:hypothetical protein